jgi:hypothetical protein
MDSGLRRNDEQGNQHRCKLVILAQARIHLDLKSKWIPACAGMTQWVSFASFALKLFVFSGPNRR